MRKGIYRFSCLVIILLLQGILSASAQENELPEAEEPMIGMIPGTQMTRDEFRARARAQLTAIALNAMTYRLINGNYPSSYPELMGSNCWNIVPENMFRGGRVRSIFFEPGPEHMTSRPAVGMPYQFIELAPPPLPSGPPAFDPENPEEYPGPGDVFDEAAFTSAVRVDPALVENTTEGDVFYYSADNTLQLVMYAADGTYEEFIEMVPSARWERELGVPANEYWPDDVLAAQVLFYLEELLPENYNHVNFMADKEPLTQAVLKLLSAQMRLEMAAELDLQVLNPFTQEPISIAESFQRGCLVEPDPNNPVPLYICLLGNRVVTHDDLLGAKPAPVAPQQPAKPEEDRKPSRPALGGRR